MPRIKPFLKEVGKINILYRYSKLYLLDDGLRSSKLKLAMNNCDAIIINYYHIHLRNTLLQFWWVHWYLTICFPWLRASATLCLSVRIWLYISRTTSWHTSQNLGCFFPVMNEKTCHQLTFDFTGVIKVWHLQRHLGISTLRKFLYHL